MRSFFYCLTKSSITLFIIISFFTGCAVAPLKPAELKQGDYEYTKEYISWLIRREMSKNEVVGLSVALVDDQKVVWADGFGYADKVNNIPATTETVYRVGSISKLFTATAAMQLSEQGKLDIDKPFQDYLPEFSIKSRFPDSAPITPRTVMTHHSGLPSNLAKGMWSDNPLPFNTIIKQVREEYAAYPPDSVFSYSNLGVTLLGLVVETASGMDYVSYMDTSVLRPIEMANSSFSPALAQTTKASRAYRDGTEVEEPSLRDVPAGGLNSNVVDLSRFIRMVLAGGTSGERQILKPETLEEMLRLQNVNVPLDLNFRVGLGWMLGGLGDIDIKNGGRVAHHSGATVNYHSMLIILPEHKLGVVVLANSSRALDVVNKVATETIKLALEAKTGIRQPERAKPAFDDGALSTEELDSYEGRYATMIGVANVSKKSAGLRAEVMGTRFHLVPRPDRLLGVKYMLLGLIPISLGNLDYIGITLDTVAGHDILKARMDGQELLVGERIRQAPIPDKWLHRLGKYELANAGDDTVLVEEVMLRDDNGLLLIEYSMPLFFKGRLSLAVAPVSDTEAVILGLGSGMGETITLETFDGEEALRYSGYVYRKRKE